MNTLYWQQLNIPRAMNMLWFEENAGSTSRTKKKKKIKIFKNNK